MTSDNRDYPGNAEGPGLLPAFPLGNGEGAKFFPGLLLAQLKANRTMTGMALGLLTSGPSSRWLCWSFETRLNAVSTAHETLVAEATLSGCPLFLTPLTLSRW